MTDSDKLFDTGCLIDIYLGRERIKPYFDALGNKEPIFYMSVITEAELWRGHPWWENWWPHGHIIGWEHTFIHEINHLLECIVNDKEVGPHGATFEDGYKAAVVCDAILHSAGSKRQVDVDYK